MCITDTMPPRRRPNRLPRRVRHLLQIALTRARRRLSHQPRPTLEDIVGSAAQLEAQIERLPSSRHALRIIQDILNEPPIQLPVRESVPEPRPEPPSSEAQISIDLTDDEQPDSPPPAFELTNNLRNEDCPVCCARPQQVLLNCQGRHALCGHCPSHIYKRSAKCPFCRDSFSEIAPLYGVPLLEILPLTGVQSSQT